MPPIGITTRHLDDLDPYDTGEIEVMHGGCVEQGDHPSRTLLLHIALDDRTTIAEVDGHLSAFLDERLGDGWPTGEERRLDFLTLRDGRNESRARRHVGRARASPPAHSDGYRSGPPGSRRGPRAAG